MRLVGIGGGSALEVAARREKAGAKLADRGSPSVCVYARCECLSIGRTYVIIFNCRSVYGPVFPMVDTSEKLGPAVEDCHGIEFGPRRQRAATIFADIYDQQKKKNNNNKNETNKKK